MKQLKLTRLIAISCIFIPKMIIAITLLFRYHQHKVSRSMHKKKLICCLHTVSTPKQKTILVATEVSGTDALIRDFTAVLRLSQGLEPADVASYDSFSCSLYTNVHYIRSRTQKQRRSQKDSCILFMQIIKLPFEFRLF